MTWRNSHCKTLRPTQRSFKAWQLNGSSRYFCSPVLRLFTIFSCITGTADNSHDALSFWMVNVTDSLTY